MNEREQLAARILEAYLQNPNATKTTPRQLASVAFQIADEFLKAAEEAREAERGAP